MTWIEKSWTQFPGEPIAQEGLVELLPKWVSGDRLRLARQLFSRAAVRTRHMVASPGEMLANKRTFAQKNDIYKRSINTEVQALASKVRAETSADQRSTIDLLITVSCTGFQIPAMDALVIRALGLPVGLRRINLTQHGCAGGAASLGMAHEWLAANPTKRALVVCSEFCSLAFQPEDSSNENLVSAAIFGDGSASVLLAGAGTEALTDRALSIRDTYREFFPETEHFMGFDVNEQGLKINLSQDVVPFSRNGLPDVFARMCAKWSVASPQSFETGSLHPGGRRILEILEDDVGLSKAVTRSSWECLARYGNLSSVSVLVALDRIRRAMPAAPEPTLGLVSAFGPGFGAEFSLLEMGAAA